MENNKLEKVLKYITLKSENLNEVYDFIKIKPIISEVNKGINEIEMQEKKLNISQIVISHYRGKFFTCSEIQLKMLDCLNMNYGHKVTGSILRSLFHRKIRKVKGKASYYYYCPENFTNE